MKVISESFLRELFRKEIPETFRVEEGQILTPSAAQLLGERGVKIIRDEDRASEKLPEVRETAGDIPEPQYVVAGGGMLTSKPEHMTQLRGNCLVAKDHVRIILRGRLDSLQSEILLVQGKAHGSGLTNLVRDLGDVLAQARAVMRAEVLEEPLPEGLIMGLGAAELRAQSHHPKQYFGVDHLLPSFTMGEMLLTLNALRSLVREVEVAAVSAFRAEFGSERPDIIQALNRMSSAVYIMMLREATGRYR
ncbi:hypothetical protein OOT00_05045 [Desulfobotulus sp. H1]|uniref:Cobalamin adenosyltransferase-like domain-containing protein n=1 Tax=Desulfobotulus pelophilus TaxID=2823377 RepID=A0ABT3N7C3_9BACT|nr:hypothetical protein [Desulfobotulus pelophilus]MCW7753350.1 hypothetical protein [Desulfobotulus pelophilus]